MTRCDGRQSAHPPVTFGYRCVNVGATLLASLGIPGHEYITQCLALWHYIPVEIDEGRMMVIGHGANDQ